MRRKPFGLFRRYGRRSIRRATLRPYSRVGRLMRPYFPKYEPTPAIRHSYKPGRQVWTPGTIVQTYQSFGRPLMRNLSPPSFLIPVGRGSGDSLAFDSTAEGRAGAGRRPEGRRPIPSMYLAPHLRSVAP